MGLHGELVQEREHSTEERCALQQQNDDILVSTRQQHEDEIGKYTDELKDGEAKRIVAEERCAQLEDELVQARESAAHDRCLALQRNEDLLTSTQQQHETELSNCRAELQNSEAQCTCFKDELEKLKDELCHTRE